MSYKQLTPAERAQISILRQAGHTKAEIAKHLDRHPSTIGRELSRNSCNDGRYRVHKACSRARGRKAIPRKNLRLTDDMITLLQRRLSEGWSPQQITERCHKDGIPMVSHESIYAVIWADKAQGGHLYTYLRTAQKQRRKRRGTYEKRGTLQGKRMIDARPESINTREEFGHWEGDTMVGPTKHCLLTLVERKTRFTIICPVPSRTIEEINIAALIALQPYRKAVKSITFDNGTEFHGYKHLEEKLGITVYFAHPHHSWERGTNENTNGLIRQYAPKRITLKHMNIYRCGWVSRMLNERPRKTLNYQKPSECFSEEMKIAL